MAKPSSTNAANKKPVPISILTKSNFISPVVIHETKVLTNGETNVVRPLPPKTNQFSGVVSNAIPATSSLFAPRPVQNVFEAQLALAQRNISSGSIDGAVGSQTRAAFRAFQQQQHLPVTGELNAVTKAALLLNTSPYTNYVVTSNDLARLQPVATTWVGKSQQSELAYETILEAVAEKFAAHPGFVRQLNPSINWSNVVEETVVKVPNFVRPSAKGGLSFIRIQLGSKTLQAFDAENNLILHVPCSIARRVEKRPVGELHVVKIAPDPDYTFDPEVFPESAEARQIKGKLILPPGPNNPVGKAWISLDKPGYGIHGTPKPEDVGRTESHGCFRLANWNAEILVRLVSIGTPVRVEP